MIGRLCRGAVVLFPLMLAAVSGVVALALFYRAFHDGPARDSHVRSIELGGLLPAAPSGLRVVDQHVEDRCVSDSLDSRPPVAWWVLGADDADVADDMARYAEALERAGWALLRFLPGDGSGLRGDVREYERQLDDWRVEVELYLDGAELEISAFVVESEDCAGARD